MKKIVICLLLALIVFLILCNPKSIVATHNDGLEILSSPTPAPTVTLTYSVEKSVSNTKFTAKPTTTPIPTPTITPEPIWEPPEEEIIISAKMMYGEARGESDERCAATLWCAINRTKDPLQRWSTDLIEVITQKNQFTGYSKNNPVTDRLKALAKDVLIRAHNEEMGMTEVGRTLPQDYYFFGGSTGRNRFRKNYEIDGNFWDWSLPNPYEEEVIDNVEP